ncbi:MAG TPA: hypothetical protein VNO55_21905 [Polyangia bacterium]|nr:hypothetical protein [Polyangia bacterium]
MSTVIELGEVNDAGQAPALTGVSIDLRALELVAHWGRCGLTADWLARFFAYDFAPGSREAAVSVLSTAINELLENAAKFCSDKQHPVRISVRHHGDFVRIATGNTAGDNHVQRLRTTLDQLSHGSLEELFTRLMQNKSAPGASGIGLLILKKDYGARLAVRLAPLAAAGEWDVQVTADLDIAEVEQT